MPEPVIVNVLDSYREVGFIMSRPQDLARRYRGRDNGKPIRFEKPSDAPGYKIAALIFGDREDFAFVHRPQDSGSIRTALYLPKDMDDPTAARLIEKILKEGSIDKRIVRITAEGLRM